MKTITKVLCGVGVLTLAGLIPYRFESDEDGSCKVTALLWNMTKVPGEETDTYTVDVLPFIQFAEEGAEEDVDEEAEETEEPAAEETEAVGEDAE